MSYISDLEMASCNKTAARRFIDTLNQNQMKELVEELESRFFWLARVPRWFSATKKQLSFLRWSMRIAAKRLKTGKCAKEISPRGSVIIRDRFVSGDSFDFEWHKLDSSWELLHRQTQYDAVWTQSSTFTIVTFCESDVIFNYCPNRAVFRAELLAIAEWYREQ